MKDTDQLIAQVYSAFNSRNIDEVFRFMSDAVDWPKASEGGRALGKDEVRAYWTRQWAEMDPHVEPVEVNAGEGGGVHVRVHQVVKNLKGEILFDQMVLHVFRIRNGLIERMDIREGEPSFG